MPRTCTICAHADCDEIDRALVAGEPFRRIAARFGTSASSLRRHKAEHLPDALAQASAAAEVVRGDDLLQQTRDLQAKALAILEKAELGGDLRTAIAANREARGCLELLGRLVGELDNRPQVNVFLSPQWQLVRQAVFVALEPYPEARLAVSERLARVESPS